MGSNQLLGQQVPMEPDGQRSGSRRGGQHGRMKAGHGALLTGALKGSHVTDQDIAGQSPAAGLGRTWSSILGTYTDGQWGTAKVPGGQTPLIPSTVPWPGPSSSQTLHTHRRVVSNLLSSCACFSSLFSTLYHVVSLTLQAGGESGSALARLLPPLPLSREPIRLFQPHSLGVSHLLAVPDHVSVP